MITQQIRQVEPSFSGISFARDPSRPYGSGEVQSYQQYYNNLIQNSSSWSPGRTNNPIQNANGHWAKHRNEFPEYHNANQYIQGTQNFMTNPPSGTLIRTRVNGDTLYYNPTTNTFGVRDMNGAPKTMFRPNTSNHGYPTNLDYFNAQ